MIRLLDAAKAIGILEEVKDEGHFWENRDVKALVETVGQWNAGLAAVVGQFKESSPARSSPPRSPNFPTSSISKPMPGRRSRMTPKRPKPICAQRPTPAPSAASGGTTGWSGTRTRCFAARPAGTFTIQRIGPRMTLKGNQQTQFKSGVFDTCRHPNLPNYAPNKQNQRTGDSSRETRYFPRFAATKKKARIASGDRCSIH